MPAVRKQAFVLVRSIRKIERRTWEGGDRSEGGGGGWRASFSARCDNCSLKPRAAAACSTANSPQFQGLAHRVQVAGQLMETGCWNKAQSHGWQSSLGLYSSTSSQTTTFVANYTFT